MLKHKAEQISFGVKIVDLIICLFAFGLAHYYRFKFLPILPGPAAEGSGGIASVSWLLAASLGLHFITYSYLGFYSSIRQKTPFRLVEMTVKAFVIDFFVLGTMVFVLQEKGTSRYFFSLFLVLNYLLLFSVRMGAWVLLSVARRKGYNFRRVLIVGAGQNAKNVITMLKGRPHWGYVAEGVLLDAGEGGTGADLPVPVLGRLENLKAIIEARAIDEVIFALDYIDGPRLAEQSRLCYDIGIPIRFSLTFFDLPGLKLRLSDVNDIPFLSFYRTAITPLEAFCKRAMDLAIASVGLALTASLFPWIAYRIKRESPGPVIFSQVRVGENGRTFRCLKFRTMVPNADALKGELLHQNQMDGPMFKIEKDPRTFSFGSFLRNTSLDELPQFWNVFKGEMSVVGTRPPLPEEVQQYDTAQRRRLSIRPGMTGLWQVSGRSRVSDFREIVALDLQYIDHWSLRLDLKLIAQTIWVVLARKGAV